jgi:hypothetical protein
MKSVASRGHPPQKECASAVSKQPGKSSVHASGTQRLPVQVCRNHQRGARTGRTQDRRRDEQRVHQPGARPAHVENAAVLPEPQPAMERAPERRKPLKRLRGDYEAIHLRGIGAGALQSGLRGAGGQVQLVLVPRSAGHGFDPRAAKNCIGRQPVLLLHRGRRHPLRAHAMSPARDAHQRFPLLAPGFARGHWAVCACRRVVPASPTPRRCLLAHGILLYCGPRAESRQTALKENVRA